MRRILIVALIVMVTELAIPTVDALKETQIEYGKTYSIYPSYNNENYQINFTGHRGDNLTINASIFPSSNVLYLSVSANYICSSNDTVLDRTDANFYNCSINFWVVLADDGMVSIKFMPGIGTIYYNFTINRTIATDPFEQRLQELETGMANLTERMSNLTVLNITNITQIHNETYLNITNVTDENITFLNENITQLAQQYTDLQLALDGLKQLNNTTIEQWRLFNDTFSNISSLQKRISAEENRTIPIYNDTLLWKRIDELSKQINETTTGSRIRYVNQTVDDYVAKVLGAIGIIFGVVGMSLAVCTRRSKKKMLQVPEDGQSTPAPSQEQPAFPTMPITRGAVSAEAPQAAVAFPTITPAYDLPKPVVIDKPTPTEIEDIFLLYHDGRLISHHTRRLKPDVDGAIVGGMLTAVQNFIQESFATEEEGGDIKTLEYGKVKILIERNAQLYMAAVISGEEPSRLRDKMRLTLARIWDNCGDYLKQWDGSMTKIKSINGLLRKMIEEI